MRVIAMRPARSLGEPRRLEAARSIERRCSLLPDTLEVGPQVALLLRRRGRRLDVRTRRWRRRHSGEHLFEQLLRLDGLPGTLSWHLGVAIVVGVEAGPAGDLGDLGAREARDVVVQEQTAPWAVIVDDVSEPDGTRVHRSSSGRGMEGSILPNAERRNAGSARWPVNTEEADYYRLRTEWLRYKSHLFDSLTGLPALAAVLEDVRKLLETQRGTEVLYVDLGRSGWHETELGWATYDGVVREFAGILRACRESSLLAPDDVACLSSVRSDRFLVFLGSNGSLSPQARRERLLQTLCDAMKRAPEGSALRAVRVAAGHARIEEHPMTRSERLIQHAVLEAVLMSLVEREGADSARHEALAALIAGARVRSVFHPIVRLADGAVVGHEALTRADFQGAFESVEDLFTFAESTDLVVDFERVCRRTAIHASTSLASRGHLFLNASARAVTDPDWLTGETPPLLAEAGLKPSDVVIEVTERLAVAHHEGVSAGLRALKERGYRVAVDDMGAGYASLQALAAIEPDFLKFDTSLVRDIDKSSIKRSLLDTLRVLGEKIRARVIAEGIEREEERDTLARLGIEFGQGFLVHAYRRGDPAAEGRQAERGRTPHHHVGAGRGARRHRPHHSPRHRGAPGGRLPSLRRPHRRQEDLAPGRGLQAARHPELLPGGALGPLLRAQHDVVPGRRALRPGPGVGVPQDPRGAAGEEPAVSRAHPGPVRGAAGSLEGLLEEDRCDRVADRCDPPPAPGPDRILFVREPPDQDLPAVSVSAGLLSRRALPVRKERRARRGTHLRSRACSAHRGVGVDLRDASRLQRGGVR